MLKFALLLAAASGAPAADSDFSGAWKLNPARSDLHHAHPPAAARLDIDHRGKTLHCTIFNDKWTVPIGGDPVKSKMGELTLSTIAKWEGDVLLVNAIVVGPAGQYTQMDRWKLSRDGARLSIRREIVRRAEDHESLLVYERETTR